MESNNETLDSKPTPSDAGAVKAVRRRSLANIWRNTKPSYPTVIRLMFLIFQILIVVVGGFAGMEVVGLDDPWSAPLLNFACAGFGICELITLIQAMREPVAEA